jgi:hypothetical protein
MLLKLFILKNSKNIHRFFLGFLKNKWLKHVFLYRKTSVKLGGNIGFMGVKKKRGGGKRKFFIEGTRPKKYYYSFG